ncbi:MAG: TolC family protein [Elusimicrobia bacterium]|nr:TolC family protein [Elusimicrobiota bacterium]
MLAFLLGALLLPAAAAAPQPLTLDSAYAAALKWSEILAQQGETAAQLQARVEELRSYVLPQLGLAGSEIVQHTPASVSGLSSGQRSRETAQLTLHQTLFTGLRDYLAVRQAKAQAAGAELALARARQLLYGDVAQAYLNLLSVRHQAAIQLEILRTTDDLIRELRQRQKLGRSRVSEVLAAESQRAQVAAQVESARLAEAGARLLLRFLTGIDEDVELAELPLPDAPLLEPHLDASQRRPDVEQARQAARAARLGVPIAARQRWPLIDLDGNYYLHRPPPQDPIKWDVTFSLALPLYQGGRIRAQVREAEAAGRSSEYALVQVRRQADLDVRTAHSALAASLSVVSALVEAARTAAESAAAQTKDYRAGLVTNLDVLGALNVLEQAQLGLDQSRMQARLARAQLGVASGLLEK